MFFCNNCDNILYMKIEEIQDKEVKIEVKEKMKQSDQSFVKNKNYILL